MVAQPARRADDDVRAVAERAALLGGVHPADAGRDAHAGRGVEPLQLLLTCSASSRVGAMISASAARPARPPSSSASAIARPNATVLPDPVCAETTRSRPCASGCEDGGLDGGERGVATRGERLAETAGRSENGMFSNAAGDAAASSRHVAGPTALARAPSRSPTPIGNCSRRASR